MPEPGQEETVRIVALDRSFHIGCYKCEVSDGRAAGEVGCCQFRKDTHTHIHRELWAVWAPQVDDGWSGTGGGEF